MHIYAHRSMHIIPLQQQCNVQIEAGNPSFERVKESLERKLRNANMQPAQHASYLRLRCLTASWPVEDRLQAMQALTPASLQVSVSGV